MFPLKMMFMGFFFLLFKNEASGQLLGAGTGVGSCRAFPYRAEEVDWEECPPEASCCNEYGYCRTRVSCNSCLK